MEGGGRSATEVEQPQWVSRWKLNLRGRSLRHANTAAVAATMRSAVASCQSIAGNIAGRAGLAMEIFRHAASRKIRMRWLWPAVPMHPERPSQRSPHLEG